MNPLQSQAVARILPQSLPARELEDLEYALVSVLYHALQGVQACEQYIDDAERAGDDELQQFFQECRDQQAERAARAKQLLVSRAEAAPANDDVGVDDDGADTERAP